MQLEEAVTLAEEAARKRREAETQLAAAEARVEAAGAQGALSRSGDGRDVELRNLRDELAAQEDAVREARRLKDHVRCVRLEKNSMLAKGAHLCCGRYAFYLLPACQVRT